MANRRVNPDRLMKASDYSYDYDRSYYHAKYYAKRREALNKKAVARYRRIVTAKFVGL